MTLDELIAEARKWGANPYNHSVRMCQAVIAMFGEALPCGYEAPEIVTLENPSFVSERTVLIEWPCGRASPAEARAYAAAILRAADAADGGRALGRVEDALADAVDALEAGET